MRARSIRLSILILVILALGIASLGFRNINVNIPGFPALERGGTGPLGLKLGLDLRGGGHLVYQADTGTRVDVSFPAPEVSFTPADASAGPGTPETADSAPNQPAANAAETTPEPAHAEAGAESSSDIAGHEIDDQNKPSEISDSAIEESVAVLIETEFTVERRDANSFRIKTVLLDDDRLAVLRDGLEEQFGSADSFEVDEISDPDANQMEGVLDIINRRVNRFGTEEPIIQLFGEDRIIVQLPGASGSITKVGLSEPFYEGQGPQDAVAVLEGLGVENYTVVEGDTRSFEIRSDTLSANLRQQLRTELESWFGAIQHYEVSSGIDDAKSLIGQTARLEFKERICTDPTCRSYTDGDIGLTGDDLARADVSADPSGLGWAINIQFDNRGSDVFADLTQRLFQRQDIGRIAVFLDDEELIAPVARAWIRDGRSQITGNFQREEARTIAIQLDSGRLPVPLKLIQESDVDALLGSESLRNSLLAGFVGLGLVMIFMLAYYRMSGVVASLALLFYAIVVLAVFKLIPVTLTLSHIGGFILSIGMAVDANILIFERMKEEIRTGRTLASSMEVGFNRAWPAIRDSNFSTIITCLVLLWFGDRLGGGLVTGFALSLLIGVAVSMFTAVVLSRNLLQLLAWIGLAHRIQMFTPEKVERTVSAVGGGS